MATPSAALSGFTLMPVPDSKPICPEQLAAEVKGIYAGLVMVESKCIEVDNMQQSLADATSGLNQDQWQALIALHRSLLHEHHDFFLATQHPSASPGLRRLASKYAMPARMWRHGIHSFLELLRRKLPDSLEYMITFIYPAYGMMALLYETVPAFEGTWIECLRDLGRYRMAIEDDDIRARELWTGVSRHWYTKALAKALTTGRLHHHLAILARPSALQQLLYYCKSLVVAIPFLSAKESILTLFGPILAKDSPNPCADESFVRLQGALFSRKLTAPYSKHMDKHERSHRLGHRVEGFLGLLDLKIGRSMRRWWGPERSLVVAPNPVVQLNYADVDPMSSTTVAMQKALQLCRGTDEIILRRVDDAHALPYIHARLAFVSHLLRSYEAAMIRLESQVPWKLLTLMLNATLAASRPAAGSQVEGEFPILSPEPRPLLAKSCIRSHAISDTSSFSNDSFSYENFVDFGSMTNHEDTMNDGTSLHAPTNRRGRKQSLTEDPIKTFVCEICSRRFRRQEHLKRHCRSLHEDQAIRGRVWADRYFPNDRFTTSEVNDDEKNLEVGSVADKLKEQNLAIRVITAQTLLFLPASFVAVLECNNVSKLYKQGIADREIAKGTPAITLIGDNFRTIVKEVWTRPGPQLRGSALSGLWRRMLQLLPDHHALHGFHGGRMKIATLT